MAKMTQEETNQHLAEMFPQFYKHEVDENGKSRLINIQEANPEAVNESVGVQGSPSLVGGASAILGLPIGARQQRNLSKINPNIVNEPLTPTIQTPITETKPITQNIVESTPNRKIVGATGHSNWVRSMSDVPDVIANQAENMRKDNPKGGQFLINQDIANKTKIENIGEGNKRLYRMPNGTQLMLSPEEIMKIELKEKELQEAKTAEEKAKTKSPYNRMVNTGKLFNALLNKVPILSTPLATGLMGAEGQESANRFEQGDVPGGLISGAGAIGSAVSLVPHKGVQAVGRGLSIASPLALEAYDYLRKPKRE
jgi:hypothetical protein